MNKIMKLTALLICVSLVLALVPGFTVYGASTVASGRFGDGNNLTWKLDSTGTLTISGEGEMPNLNAGSYPWNKNFSVNIRSVVIEDGVTTIGGDAFSYQEHLSEVTTPDSVITIKYSAFYYCTSLTKVNIGRGIETIEWWAFYGCDNLKDVYYSAGRIDWAKINIDSNNGPLTNADIHFSSSATEVIDSGSCGPDLIWTLDSDCTLTISGTGPMDDMSDGSPWADESEIIFNVIVEDGAETIGESAFLALHRVTDVSLPDSVTAIGGNAFGGCSNLKSIDIPDSVTIIGEKAFSGCDSLTAVTIPDSVTELGDGVLSYCHYLTDVKLGSGITYISREAFSNCNRLKNVSIPYGVTIIGQYAFLNCRSLSDLNLPDSITYIEEGAYSACNSLKSINLPSRVRSIGYGAFLGCQWLAYIDLGGSVTDIGDYAFSECYKLAEVTIPASVRRIGEYAFGFCYGLADVYYGGSETDWADISIDTGNAYLTSANIHYNSFIPAPPATEIKNVSVKIDGNSITVVAEAVNIPSYAVVIAAAYSADGTLLEVASVIDGSAVLTEDGIVTVKVFCWESIKTLRPMCESASVKL